MITDLDPQRDHPAFQEHTLPLVTRLRFDKSICLFIMQDNKGLILTTKSNDSNWRRWIQDHGRSVRSLCKVAIISL